MDESKVLQIILDKLNKLNAMEKDISGMKSDISNLKQDVSSIKSDIAIISENYKATNAALDKLIDWTQHLQIDVKFPVFKKE